MTTEGGRSNGQLHLGASPLCESAGLDDHRGDRSRDEKHANPATDGLSWPIDLVTRTQTSAVADGTTVVTKSFDARHTHIYLYLYLYDSFSRVPGLVAKNSPFRYVDFCTK